MILPIPNLNAVGYSVNARGLPRLQGGHQHRGEAEGQAPPPPPRPDQLLRQRRSQSRARSRDALDVLGKKRVLGLITAYNADTGAPPAPDTDVLLQGGEAAPPSDLRPGLGQVQPLPPRRRARPRRLVPARPLPPELHGRPGLRGLPRSGAAAGAARAVSALAVASAAVLWRPLMRSRQASGISFFSSRAKAFAPREGQVQPVGLEPARCGRRCSGPSRGP